MKNFSLFVLTLLIINFISVGLSTTEEEDYKYYIMFTETEAKTGVHPDFDHIDLFIEMDEFIAQLPDTTKYEMMLRMEQEGTNLRLYRN